MNADLTTRTKGICQALVKRHLGHEASFFEVIWNAFWEVLGVARVEEIESPWAGEAPQEDSIKQLGAVGGQSDQALDTLFVIRAITDGENRQQFSVDAKQRAQYQRLANHNQQQRMTILKKLNIPTMHFSSHLPLLSQLKGQTLKGQQR